MLYRRALILSFLAIAASFLVLPVSAGDWKCGKKGGCVASYCCDENGKLRSVDMEEGMVVATEIGWVVNANGGWYPISSN